MLTWLSSQCLVCYLFKHVVELNLCGICLADRDDGDVPNSRKARGMNDDRTSNGALAFHHVTAGRDRAWSVMNDLGRLKRNEGCQTFNTMESHPPGDNNQLIR